MASAKEKLLQLVEALPDDATQTEIEEKLIQNFRYARHIRSLVAQGERDIEEGRTLTHDDLKKKRGLG